MLNGKPLIQGKYPVCPTCSALLARGYGVDNIDCPEIKSIRDRINSEYLGINNAIEVLTPLLELLDDGYFVIADARLYPTDGTDHYFANVPDSLSTITATSFTSVCIIIKIVPVFTSYTFIFNTH